jgi:Ca-activated chloride channel homolog
MGQLRRRRTDVGDDHGSFSNPRAQAATCQPRRHCHPARARAGLDRATAGHRMPAQWGIEKLRTSVTVRVNGPRRTRRGRGVVPQQRRRAGEGDYVYPLPGEAVFTSYSLYQGDQELRGEMMDAAQARASTRDRARAARPGAHRADGQGHAARAGLPIEPGQTRRMTLRYTQVLDRAGRRAAVPLRAAGVQNGGAGQWSGLCRVHCRGSCRPARPRPDAGPSASTFSIIVDDGRPLSRRTRRRTCSNVQRARSHDVRPRDELSGDFAVFLPFAERRSAFPWRHIGDPARRLLHAHALAARRSGGGGVPRDVTVVVDVSGSMSGEKMEQARRALHAA